MAGVRETPRAMEEEKEERGKEVGRFRVRQRVKQIYGGWHGYVAHGRITDR